jgi:hypothetical protein
MVKVKHKNLTGAAQKKSPPEMEERALPFSDGLFAKRAAIMPEEARSA